MVSLSIRLSFGTDGEFLNKVNMSSTVPFVRAEVEPAGLFDELGGGEVAVRTERRRVRQRVQNLI